MTARPLVGGGRPPPWLLPGLFAAVAGLVYAADLGGTGVGRVLAPALALTFGGAGPETLRSAAAVFLAGAVVANVALLRLVPFRVQVLVVWAELLALFIAFFDSFELKLSVIADKLPFLTGVVLSPAGFLQGAALSLFVCAIAVVGASALALAAALARLSRSGLLFGIASFYISFFRGTPLLVQVFLIYLGLPQVGIILDAIPSGVIALSLNYGAYIAEVVRAGILAIPRGQWDAAAALGLRPWQVFHRVVMPQAMSVIVPPTFSQFIAMLKDSSLVSMMGVWELMFLARSYGRAEYRYIEMLLTAAVIYWALSIGFELIQARLERYYGKGRP
jgi:polar amino acid transport system permease protein